MVSVEIAHVKVVMHLKMWLLCVRELAGWSRDVHIELFSKSEAKICICEGIMGIIYNIMSYDTLKVIVCLKKSSIILTLLPWMRGIIKVNGLQAVCYT